jgi:hypothetical protein
MSHSIFARPLRVSLLLLAAILLALGVAAPAQAFQVSVGTHFTNPPTGRPDNYVASLDQALRNVPCYSGHGVRPAIHASEYHLTQQSITSTLEAKSRCGVAVGFLTFTRKSNPLSHDKVDQLARALKGQPWSWVNVCRNACGRGGSTGINHMKLWAMSRSGSTPFVVFSGSGNASGDTDRAAFNQWTVLFDRSLYGAARACIQTLRADRALPVCKPGVSHDRKMRLEFTRDANDLLDVLKRVKCVRGSQVRIPQWGATITDVVPTIKRLDDQGCDTRVIGNASTWFGGAKKWKIGGRKVDALTYLARTGTLVWEARKDRRGHDNGLYLHEKAVTLYKVRSVPGGYLNISGSRNLTRASNDDQTLWYYSKGAVMQQIGNFNAIANRTWRVR